jgi:hypothetical protein
MKNEPTIDDYRGQAIRYNKWIEELQAERDRYRDALSELVRLKDGPRDDAYRNAKDTAWDTARKVLKGEQK